MFVSIYKKKNYLTIAIIACVITFFLWLVLPPIDIYRYAHSAPKSWAILQQTKEKHPKLRIRHHYKPLKAIATALAFTAIMGEDVDYLGHGAFDFAAIREALKEWLIKGKKLRGASTITQQLAKNLYLSHDRSWWRKLREVRYAFWLEIVLSKRRILELYLNIIELGEGIYGVEAAAQHYFGLHASQLNYQQAAELAASIPSPKKHNPHTRTAAWYRRLQAINHRMQNFSWVRDRLTAYTIAPKRQKNSADTQPLAQPKIENANQSPAPSVSGPAEDPAAGASPAAEEANAF
ncbi:MAG: monofunctional biosynthetic peptidoglycan transglycosylase [Deltaproteobacteria bacterium]|nr:monofunctional biosynthetic peptidoglycan transglycosylase [Deltaproteobacteria bacterium]